MQKIDNTKPKLARMSTPVRRAIGVTKGSLVKMSRLEPGQSLPLVIQPALEGVDLISWAVGNQELIERQLLIHGAILFRDFHVKKPAVFQNLIKAVSGDLLEYTYRSTPRHQVEGRIYTSTEYPASESIPLHNEMAYTRSWPMKVWFCCIQAAQQGGETPIADSRKVLQRISPAIRKQFAEKQVMYVRNYDDGFDLNWQEVFQTRNRSEVEQYCKATGIDYEWKANNCLRTQQVCQSVASHPVTGEEVWFNQAHLFHITSLAETVRDALLSNFKEEDLPRNTYYGDGSRIEASDLDEIGEAFRQETITFEWRAGDVLLVDNMLTAHGRRPYQGPRKTIVGMADPYQPAEHKSRTRGVIQALPAQTHHLSPQQKRLWRLLQADGGQPSQARCVVAISGKLDRQRLKAAIQEIVKRHDILRTTFQYETGESLPLPIVNENLVGIHETNIRAIEERTTGALDFKPGPAIDVRIASRAADSHVLEVRMAPLCTDRKGLTNVLRELARQYENGAGGEAIEEKMQNADLAEWLNELLESRDTKTGREYWKKHHVSNLESLQLPCEKRSGTETKFKRRVIRRSIEATEAANIRGLCGQYDTTGQSFFLACWHALLWRLIGEADITVGVSADGRNYQELDGTIGLFSKFLPAQIHFESGIRFSSVLRQARDIVNEAYDWQQYFSFQQITGPNAEASELSYFPFSFEYEEFRQHAAGEVTFSMKEQDVCIDRFKVNLCCLTTHDSLAIEFHYDACFFREEDIARLAESFEKLISSALANPEAPVSRLDLLTEQERELLVNGLNDTKIAYPTNKCAQQIIEEQADLTPEAKAVVCDGQQMSYGELNGRANQLANYLRSRGVGAEQVVGVMVRRGIEMVVGLLGVMKAGAAYLPLDADYPKQRLAYMVEDAGVKVVITQEELGDRVGEFDGEMIKLDRDWEEISKHSEQRPEVKVSAENLAYVIYTSGSTGKPKGVMIEHGSLLNYILAIVQRMPLAPSSYAMVSTLSADLGNTALYPSLCTGATLHIISSDRAMHPQALGAYMREHRPECLKIVPSHLGGLMAAADAETVLPARLLVLGGEACSWEMAEQARAHGCEVMNHYGPTETTVGVLTYEVKLGEAKQASGRVPAGRPLSNTRVYVLDEWGELTPAGIAGELHVAGKQVSRGYLGKPDATAEKFIPDQFSGEAGGRLYRTGDLVRYTREAEIEFLGRIDQQVKVRGYRIELGEIEAVVEQYPGVVKSVATLREDAPQERRLVAYVVTSQEQFTTGELGAFLRERLPGFMVPSSFVVLDRLPLTSNGKLDRQALPSPRDIERRVGKGYVAPRTVTEEELAKVWGELLGIEQVGVHDNFFELGGDSILIIQCVARANQRGIRLAPKQMFKYQTISELAELAGTVRAVESEQGVVSGPLPLTPIQRYFFEHNIPERHHFNQAMMLEIRRRIDPAILDKCTTSLLRHHDALRLRFSRISGHWQQTNAAAQKQSSYSHIDLSSVRPRDQTTAIESAARQLQASLDISEGPIVRIATFFLGEHISGRVLVVIHHLAVDGVSWRILLEDLQSAYEQASLGLAIELPSKTTSFKQWAAALSAYADSQQAKHEASYWEAEGSKPAAAVPVDFTEGANVTSSAEIVTMSLDQKQTRGLLQEVPRAYHTQINEALLSALARAYRTWSGQPRIRLGVEGHGREDVVEGVDVSRTVGWFTSIYPVVLEVGREETAIETLKSVKEKLRAIPNRGIGYGLLNMGSQPGAGEKKGAEIVFNYLGQVDQVIAEASPFRLARESCGLPFSEHAGRFYLLEVTGLVIAGRLEINLIYSKNKHTQQGIESLARAYEKELCSLIEQCASAEVGFTPSDFPEAQLSNQDLDKLLARIAGSEK